MTDQVMVVTFSVDYSEDFIDHHTGILAMKEASF